MRDVGDIPLARCWIIVLLDSALSYPSLEAIPYSLSTSNTISAWFSPVCLPFTSLRARTDSLKSPFSPIQCPTMPNNAFWFGEVHRSIVIWIADCADCSDCFTFSFSELYASIVHLRTVFADWGSASLTSSLRKNRRFQKGRFSHIRNGIEQLAVQRIKSCLSSCWLMMALILRRLLLSSAAEANALWIVPFCSIWRGVSPWIWWWSLMRCRLIQEVLFPGIISLPQCEQTHNWSFPVLPPILIALTPPLLWRHTQLDRLPDRPGNCVADVDSIDTDDEGRFNGVGTGVALAEKWDIKVSTSKSESWSECGVDIIWSL